MGRPRTVARRAQPLGGPTHDARRERSLTRAPERVCQYDFSALLPAQKRLTRDTEAPMRSSVARQEIGSYFRARHCSFRPRIWKRSSFVLATRLDSPTVGVTWPSGRNFPAL